MKRAFKICGLLGIIVSSGCVSHSTDKIYVQGMILSSFERSELIICNEDVLEKFNLTDADRIWLNQDFRSAKGGDIIQNYVEFLMDCEAEAQAFVCPTAKPLYVEGIGAIDVDGGEIGFGHMGLYQAEFSFVSVEPAGAEICAARVSASR